MRTATRLLAVATALTLLAAACGDDDDDSSERASAGDDGTTTTTTEAAAESGAEVKVADTSLGAVVVDADGATLYVFDSDSGGTSSCEGGCAETWPPLVTEGEPVAGDGVDAGLLGTTDRSDGSTQVTYDGRPLYTYAADSAPGDTNGQGVGGVWWAVSADGEALRDGAGGGGETTTTTADTTGVPGY